MTTPKPIRILLADDHPLARAGLGTMINKQPDMQVIAEAENGRRAIELLPEQLDGTASVLRLGDHLHVGLLVDHRTETGTSQRVVVCQQYANGFGRGHCRSTPNRNLRQDLGPSAG